jgi:hypothetical protein
MPTANQSTATESVKSSWTSCVHTFGRYGGPHILSYDDEIYDAFPQYTFTPSSPESTAASSMGGLLSQQASIWAETLVHSARKPMTWAHCEILEWLFYFCAYEYIKNISVDALKLITIEEPHVIAEGPPRWLKHCRISSSQSRSITKMTPSTSMVSNTLLTTYRWQLQGENPISFCYCWWDCSHGLLRNFCEIMCPVVKNNVCCIISMVHNTCRSLFWSHDYFWLLLVQR